MSDSCVIFSSSEWLGWEGLREGERKTPMRTCMCNHDLGQSRNPSRFGLREHHVANSWCDGSNCQPRCTATVHLVSVIPVPASRACRSCHSLESVSQMTVPRGGVAQSGLSRWKLSNAITSVPCQLCPLSSVCPLTVTTTSLPHPKMKLCSHRHSSLKPSQCA